MLGRTEFLTRPIQSEPRLESAHHQREQNDAPQAQQKQFWEARSDPDRSLWDDCALACSRYNLRRQIRHSSSTIFRPLRNCLPASTPVGRGFRMNPVGKYAAMARELVWLENYSFAAWGCSECHWLVVNPETNLSEKPPLAVKDAFKKHSCATFPRFRKRKGTSKAD